ncbi:MAG TPA: hypothetical protein VHG09_10145 [Longimicrobiales bacterium]|nr:hypothetical protein [Longimicrobiales bacterium]
MNYLRNTTILLFVITVSGCDADSGADPGAATPEVPHDVLTVDQVIGGADEKSPEYEFGRVAGLALLADGRVALVDGINNLVRVFSREGKHLFAFGREGAGPGEFSGPCCPAVDSRQRLWIRDGGNARYSIFEIHSDSAGYSGQVRMAHGDVNRWVATTFDAAGSVIDIGSRTDPQAGVRRTYRMHLDSAGSVVREEAVHKVPDDSTAVKTIKREIPGGVATLFGYQPHGPSELVAYSPNGEFAHALSSRHVIDWRAPDGSLIRTITGAVAQGPALSAREDSAAEERLRVLADRFDMTVPQLGLDVPDRKTPLRDLFFDDHGRLWVELQVPDGGDRMAHVYDVSGILERTVAWPASISLAEGIIRDETVWGVGRDSLDVPTVVRLRGLGTRN